MGDLNGDGFNDVLVTSGNQQLASGCTVLGGMVDPATDSFQLVFEGLGIFQDPIADPRALRRIAGVYSGPTRAPMGSRCRHP